MTAPSSRTPEQAPPLPPLQAQRTQVAPYPWLRRYWGLIASVAPILGGFVAWGEGLAWEGLKPREALKQLGIPVAISLALAAFVVYLLAVYIPKRDDLKEKARQRGLDDAKEREERAAHLQQQLLEAQAADRALYQQTMAGHQVAIERVSSGVERVVEGLKDLQRVVARIDSRGPAVCRHQPACIRDAEDEPTQPGAERPTPSLRPLPGRV